MDLDRLNTEKVKVNKKHWPRLWPRLQVLRHTPTIHSWRTWHFLKKKTLSGNKPGSNLVSSKNTNVIFEDRVAEPQNLNKQNTVQLSIPSKDKSFWPETVTQRPGWLRARPPSCSHQPLLHRARPVPSMLGFITQTAKLISKLRPKKHSANCKYLSNVWPLSICPIMLFTTGLVRMFCACAASISCPIPACHLGLLPQHHFGLPCTLNNTKTHTRCCQKRLKVFATNHSKDLG